MQIPTIWTKAEGQAESPEGRTLALRAWGWSSDTLATARTVAEERLRRLIERVQKGEPFPHKYTYGSRPIREEIVDQMGAPKDPGVVITRNRYGALVLNTARILFLDVDVPELEDSNRAEAGALTKLRNALKGEGTTFRIYRTAAGFRAMAVDKEYEPESAETDKLMKLVGADPSFSQLCKAQKSFRARLTPKPWRCSHRMPPGQFPRDDANQRSAFRDWLAEYDSQCGEYATCRFTETVGSGAPLPSVNAVIDLHDKLTRVGDDLPLA